jgi:hypothetical protein
VTTSADVGDTIQATVAAHNAGGSNTAPSNRIGPVTGTSPPPPTQITHVVWLWMENHGYSSIVGSSQAPYINSLANTYGLGTNYFALDHPSLPNYLEAVTGDPNVGGSDDSDNPANDATSDPSIFSQLPGGQSRSLEEDMARNCQSGTVNNYVGHHNPMIYFTNLGTDCQNFDVPFGSNPDLSAKFTFITPNLIDDMHDGTIADGDNFLKSYVPKLMATSQYQAGNTVIFITWDEDEDSGGNNQVPLIVVSPYTHGVKDGTRYDHYSLLRTTEDLLGLPALGNAASATSMVGKFGF